MAQPQILQLTRPHRWGSLPSFKILSKLKSPPFLGWLPEAGVPPNQVHGRKHGSHCAPRRLGPAAPATLRWALRLARPASHSPYLPGPGERSSRQRRAPGRRSPSDARPRPPVWPRPTAFGIGRLREIGYFAFQGHPAPPASSPPHSPASTLPRKVPDWASPFCLRAGGPGNWKRLGGQI